VLEAPRAWAMSAAYIAITVTLGYPLVSGLAAAAGVTVVRRTNPPTALT